MSGGEPSRVKIAVDQDLCIGAGQCEMLAEDTFFVDDNTVTAQVIGEGLLQIDLAHQCVEACPTRAISIVDSPNC